MPTRIYFGQAWQPFPIFTPAVAAGWEGFTPTRLVGRTVKRQAVLSSAPFNYLWPRASQNYLFQVTSQIIVRLGAAQTIAGTFKGYALFTNSTAGAHTDCQIRILSSDGSTSRGTLLGLAGGVPGSTLVTTPLTNRRIPHSSAPTTLTAVTGQARDYLVIELGFREGGFGFYQTNTQWHDDPATGDLPENETSTDTTLAPWVEFSQNLILSDTFDVPQAAATDDSAIVERSGQAAIASVSTGPETLLDLNPAATLYDLANRLADQATNDLRATFLSPLATGAVAAGSFPYNPGGLPSEFLGLVPGTGRGLLSDSNPEVTIDSAVLSAAPLNYTILDPTNRDIAGTLPLIPVPILIAPAIVNILPSDGTITVGEVVSFDVFDISSIVVCVVLAKLPEIERYEVVYDGAVFGYQYEGSSVATIVNGLHFECVRTDGWPVGVTFKTIAVNTGALVG